MLLCLMPSIICWQTPCRTLGGQVRSEQELTKCYHPLLCMATVEIDMWQLLVLYGGFITVSVWAFGLESLIPASCWAYLLSWVYFIYLVWTESWWWVATILCLCTWFANAACVAKLAGIPCIIFCPYSCSFININIDEGTLDLCFACKAR